MKLAFIEPDGFVMDENDNPIPGAKEEIERLESEGYKIYFVSHLWHLTTWDYMVKAMTKAGFWRPNFDAEETNDRARYMTLRPSETGDMEVWQWKSSHIIKIADQKKAKEILVIDQPSVVTPVARKWQKFWGTEGFLYGYSLVEETPGE
jgi:hypothetical protein